jgi:hypothetical protein
VTATPLHNAPDTRREAPSDFTRAGNMPQATAAALAAIAGVQRGTSCLARWQQQEQEIL